MFNKREYLYLLILLFCSFILFFINIDLPQLGKSEGRIAEVVREMLISKDFLHPTCLWIPYVTKPLVPYWLIIFFYKLTNTLDELTLRLPSAFFATLAVLATVILGNKIFSKKSAIFSGIILSTCYGMLTWGRCAAADILNMSAIIIATSWYWLKKDNLTFINAFFLGCLIAIAGQMKGLVGLILPICIIAIDVFLFKNSKKIFNIQCLSGLFLGLFVYIIPFLLSGNQQSSVHYNWIYMAIHESIIRAIQPFDHRGSLFTYIKFIPIWVIPWSILLMGMLYYYLINFQKLKREYKWLVLSFLFVFFIFTISGSRRSYYILPILPFAALIAGSSVEFFEKKLVKKILILQVILFFILSILLILSPIAYKLNFIPYVNTQFFYILSFHGIILLLLSSCYFISVKKRSSYDIIFLSLLGVITATGYILYEKPFFDKEDTEKQFIVKVKNLTSDKHQKIYYYKLGPRLRARLSFYLNRKYAIKHIRNINELHKLANDITPFIVISEKEHIKNISKQIKQLNKNLKIKQLFCQKVEPWRGWPNRTIKYQKSKLCSIEITNLSS